MGKSNEDPDSSEVLLPNSPTKWIQSLPLPASPPKSYSDSANQQKWVGEVWHASVPLGEMKPGLIKGFSKTT